MSWNVLFHDEFDERLIKIADARFDSHLRQVKDAKTIKR